MFECGCGDGVAVVAAEEDDGAGAGGSDIESGVEVTLGGGAFAEVGDCYAMGSGRLAGVSQFQGIRCASCMEQLSREGRGDGVLVEDLISL